MFQNVSEIIILVPSLLGLKGNLEMTLASRLSTEANLGHMDDSKEKWIMILGNLILVQVNYVYFFRYYCSFYYFSHSTFLPWLLLLCLFRLLRYCILIFLNTNCCI